MDLGTSLLIAVGLAMDAFAVSLGVGTSGHAPDLRSKNSLAFHFGIFQMGMTVLGWLAGSTVVHFIEGWDHWLAFGLLAYVGVNMIHSGIKGEDNERYTSNPTKGHTMVMLSVATSLDALAVGLSMGLLGSSVWIPSLIIGVVAFGLSAVGLFAGCRLGEKFGPRVEIVGGLLLIFIGLRVLYTHMV